MRANSFGRRAGYSTARSTINCRRCGGKTRRSWSRSMVRGSVVPNRLAIPTLSKWVARRRRVRSAAPVCFARSAGDWPNSTMGRINSDASCSGHSASKRSCCQSSVGSRRWRVRRGTRRDAPCRCHQHPATTQGQRSWLDATASPKSRQATGMSLGGRYVVGQRYGSHLSSMLALPHSR